MRAYRHESNATTAAVYGAAIAAVIGIGVVASWGEGEIVKSTYSTQQAEEYVEQSGYTDVQPTDIDTVFIGLRGCADSDAVKYEFSATAPNGSHVGIAVCKGLFKGATLRQ